MYHAARVSPTDYESAELSEWLPGALRKQLFADRTDTPIVSWRLSEIAQGGEGLVGEGLVPQDSPPSDQTAPDQANE
jgi:hypothetical protein